MTAQMAASMFTNNVSLDEPKLGGAANYQHLEHVVIDEEDSRPKTQQRHIVDSDDGTIKSSFINSRCIDFGYSNDGNFESIFPCTHSRSLFCVMVDRSIGFLIHFDIPMGLFLLQFLCWKAIIE